MNTTQMLAETIERTTGDTQFWKEHAHEYLRQRDEARAACAEIQTAQKKLRDLISQLRSITPVPPKAITYENGMDIVSFVQDIFLPEAITALETTQTNV